MRAGGGAEVKLPVAGGGMSGHGRLLGSRVSGQYHPQLTWKSAGQRSAEACSCKVEHCTPKLVTLEEPPMEPCTAEFLTS